MYLIGRGYWIFYIDYLMVFVMGGDKDEKKELEDIMVDIVMFVKCYNVLFYLVLYLLIFEGKLYEEG